MRAQGIKLKVKSRKETSWEKTTDKEESRKTRKKLRNKNAYLNSPNILHR
jgi:hypothetical protein